MRLLVGRLLRWTDRIYDILDVRLDTGDAFHSNQTHELATSMLCIV